MREIKFKFWLGHIKKMTYAHTLDSIPVKEFTPDIIPLMYSGRKDKNGVEVYEGDIIAKGTAVHFSPDKGFTDGCNPLYWYNSMEVIGNIYENPELMDLPEWKVLFMPERDRLKISNETK